MRDINDAIEKMEQMRSDLYGCLQEVKLLNEENNALKNDMKPVLFRAEIYELDDDNHEIGEVENIVIIAATEREAKIKAQTYADAKYDKYSFLVDEVTSENGVAPVENFY